MRELGQSDSLDKLMVS